jgi:hypothetical protein
LNQILAEIWYVSGTWYRGGQDNDIFTSGITRIKIKIEIQKNIPLQNRNGIKKPNNLY